MNVCLMTVPHTGTTFLEAVLKKNTGMFPTNLDGDPGAERGCIYRSHTYDEGENRRALRLAQKMPLIVTLRHPFVTEEAWKRRKYEVDRMILAYRNLVKLFWPIKNYVFSVDSPRREELMETLGKGLGFELKTDWEPVRVVGKTHDLSWKDMTPSQPVRELAEEMNEILGEFYD